MPAEGRENHLLKKGNSDAFFREKYLTKNTNVITVGTVFFFDIDDRADCEMPVIAES